MTGKTKNKNCLLLLIACIFFVIVLPFAFSSEYTDFYNSINNFTFNSADPDMKSTYLDMSLDECVVAAEVTLEGDPDFGSVGNVSAVLTTDLSWSMTECMAGGGNDTCDPGGRYDSVYNMWNANTLCVESSASGRNVTQQSCNCSHLDEFGFCKNEFNGTAGEYRLYYYQVIPSYTYYDCIPDPSSNHNGNCPGGLYVPDADPFTFNSVFINTNFYDRVCPPSLVETNASRTSKYYLAYDCSTLGDTIENINNYENNTYNYTCSLPYISTGSYGNSSLEIGNYTKDNSVCTIVGKHYMGTDILDYDCTYDVSDPALCSARSKIYRSDPPQLNLSPGSCETYIAPNGDCSDISKYPNGGSSYANLAWLNVSCIFSPSCRGGRTLILPTTTRISPVLPIYRNSCLSPFFGWSREIDNGTVYFNQTAWQPGCTLPQEEIVNITMNVSSCHVNTGTNNCTLPGEYVNQTWQSATWWQPSACALPNVPVAPISRINVSSCQLFQLDDDCPAGEGYVNDTYYASQWWQASTCTSPLILLDTRVNLSSRYFTPGNATCPAGAYHNDTFYNSDWWQASLCTVPNEYIETAVNYTSCTNFSGDTCAAGLFESTSGYNNTWWQAAICSAPYDSLGTAVNFTSCSDVDARNCPAGQYENDSYYPSQWWQPSTCAAEFDLLNTQVNSSSCANASGRTCAAGQYENDDGYFSNWWQDTSCSAAYDLLDTQVNYTSCSNLSSRTCNAGQYENDDGYFSNWWQDTSCSAAYDLLNTQVNYTSCSNISATTCSAGQYENDDGYSTTWWQAATCSPPYDSLGSAVNYTSCSDVDDRNCAGGQYENDSYYASQWWQASSCSSQYDSLDTQVNSSSCSVFAARTCTAGQYENDDGYSSTWWQPNTCQAQYDELDSQVNSSSCSIFAARTCSAGQYENDDGYSSTWWQSSTCIAQYDELDSRVDYGSCTNRSGSGSCLAQEYENLIFAVDNGWQDNPCSAPYYETDTRPDLSETVNRNALSCEPGEEQQGASWEDTPWPSFTDDTNGTIICSPAGEGTFMCSYIMITCADLEYECAEDFTECCEYEYQCGDPYVECCEYEYECGDPYVECCEYEYECGDPHVECCDYQYECGDPYVECCEYQYQCADPYSECCEYQYQCADPYVECCEYEYECGDPHVECCDYQYQCGEPFVECCAYQNHCGEPYSECYEYEYECGDPVSQCCKDEYQCQTPYTECCVDMVQCAVPQEECFTIEYEYADLNWTCCDNEYICCTEQVECEAQECAIPNYNCTYEELECGKEVDNCCERNESRICDNTTIPVQINSFNLTYDEAIAKGCPTQADGLVGAVPDPWNINSGPYGFCMNISNNYSVYCDFLEDKWGDCNNLTCDIIAEKFVKYADRFFVNMTINESDPAHSQSIALSSYGTYLLDTLDFTDTKSLLYSEIDTYESKRPATGGYTCISCGLRDAIDKLRDNASIGSNKGIVLMSDGRANYMLDGTPDFTNSALEAIDIACNDSDNTSAAANNIMIYTIGFGPGADAATLFEIANCTNGEYFESSDPAELEDIYKNISILISQSRPMPRINVTTSKENDTMDFNMTSPLVSSIFWDDDECGVSGDANCTSLIDAINARLEYCNDNLINPCDVNWTVESFTYGRVILEDLQIRTIFIPTGPIPNLNYDGGNPEGQRPFVCNIAGDCGNGQIDTGEDCDDGPFGGVSDTYYTANSSNNDGYCVMDLSLPLFSCRINVCGDGYLNNLTEKCDLGDDNNDTIGGSNCSTRCTNITSCGDGNLDLGEVCDDNNLIDGDGCSAVCTNETLCGDNMVDIGEECDDGLKPDTFYEFGQADSGPCVIDDTSIEGIAASCRLNKCGDGYLHISGEGCDYGSQCSGDNLTNCTRDNTICFTLGLDDCVPNAVNISCSPVCTDISQCINNVTDPGEQCDDGGLCQDDSTFCTSSVDCIGLPGGSASCTTRDFDGCSKFCKDETPTLILPGTCPVMASFQGFNFPTLNLNGWITLLPGSTSELDITWRLMPYSYPSPASTSIETQTGTGGTWTIKIDNSVNLVDVKPPPSIGLHTTTLWFEGKNSLGQMVQRCFEYKVIDPPVYYPPTDELTRLLITRGRLVSNYYEDNADEIKSWGPYVIVTKVWEKR